MRVQWTVKCLAQWLTYNRYSTNVCPHPRSVFCTLGFSTRLESKEAQGSVLIDVDSLFFVVFLHQGSFHKNGGGWKISKCIPFIAGKSRQHRDNSPQSQKRTFRPGPWLLWQNHWDVQLKMQLVTGIKPYHGEDLVVDSTMGNDTDSPIWKLTRHSVCKWLCNYVVHPGLHCSITLRVGAGKLGSEWKWLPQPWPCHSTITNHAGPGDRHQA